MIDKRGKTYLAVSILFIAISALILLLQPATLGQDNEDKDKGHGNNPDKCDPDNPSGKCPDKGDNPDEGSIEDLPNSNKITSAITFGKSFDNYYINIVNKDKEILQKNKFKEGIISKTIKPENQALKDLGIKKIKVKDLVLLKNVSLGIDKANISVPDVDIVKGFAVNPNELEADNIEMIITAEGSELYKCKEWSFNSGFCKGAWEKIKDLTPGQDYSLEIDKFDPGFGEGGTDKITICHIPSGNPDNKHTINISESALKAHLKHGDTIGPCEVALEKGVISTIVGSLPFYTISSNPQSCSGLKAGETCNLTWVVNATGNVSTYNFFTIFNPIQYPSYLNQENTSLVEVSIV